jgi:ABC-type antimicrobial peptide transport system permease subunit
MDTVVLLIVCANVAGLLLARIAERRRELAIRNALGAGRSRIVRQTLTESGLLALLGGVLGVPLAWGLLRLLLALNPFEIPAFNEIAINYRALFFAVLLVSLTALLFGTIPAWQASRLNVNEWLKESSRSGALGARQQRAQRLLVVIDVCAPNRHAGYR